VYNKIKNIKRIQLSVFLMFSVCTSEVAYWLRVFSSNTRGNGDQVAKELNQSPVNGLVNSMYSQYMSKQLFSHIASDATLKPLGHFAEANNVPNYTNISRGLCRARSLGY
jgi:hypothetical protein